MSAMQYARAKGGYRYHIKRADSNRALCGMEPRSNVHHNRKMRTRAGWMIRRDGVPFGQGETVCDKCAAVSAVSSSDSSLGEKR